MALRFLGTRYYTDNKTVSENYELETSYRCGGGQYLKWYMVEAVNLRMARIVIQGKEITLRITPYGQRVHLQYMERLGECSAGTFEFGGVLPSGKAEHGSHGFSNRRDRIPIEFDVDAKCEIQQEIRRNNERSRRKRNNS